MRSLIDGLPSAHPIGVQLPALFQDDAFATRLTTALDDLLAPVLCTLDNLDSYLDPELAPADFLEWLSGWVGVALDETWAPERQRALVRRAAELYRWRGTVKGLAAGVALYTGAQPQILDNGGVAWSPTPGGEVPGEPGPRLTVRVELEDPDEIEPGRLDAIVAASKPAHVPHKVEVVRRQPQEDQ